LDDKGSECIGNCDVCKSIFPKLPRIDDSTLFKCPCIAYGVRYVTKVVKQVIKDWEAENEE